MKYLQEIWSTPIDKLSISDHFQLGVHKNMLDIRQHTMLVKMSAPEARVAGESYLLYLRGRLHGFIFGMSSQLIFQTTEYEECDIIGKAAMNETLFLFSNIHD